jgi:hypothetical protein
MLTTPLKASHQRGPALTLRPPHHAPFERVSATVGLCFRETGLCGAETAASKRPVTFNLSSAETKPRKKTHQFGAICTTPGNLCLYGTAWWGWEDSNFQPNDYQSLALSTEQRARFRGLSGGLGGLELPTKRLSVASFEQPPSMAGCSMAWALLASPICRRSVPDSTPLPPHLGHCCSSSECASGEARVAPRISTSGLPRPERFRRKIVRKSWPIWLANSAMLSRLLAMHFCLMHCFRLCHRLIMAGYNAGRRWRRRWFKHWPILGGFGGLRSTSVPHYRSR